MEMLEIKKNVRNKYIIVQSLLGYTLTHSKLIAKSVRNTLFIWAEEGHGASHISSEWVPSALYIERAV